MSEKTSWISEWRSPWALRTVAGLAWLSALLGQVVTPMMRGQASDGWMRRVDFTASVSSNFLAILLLLSVLFAITELSYERRPGYVLRWTAILLGSGIFALGALTTPLTPVHSVWTLGMGLFAAFLLFVSSAYSLAWKHTRAVAIVFGLFAFAALFRLFVIRETWTSERAVESYNVARLFYLLANTFELAGVGAACVLAIRRSSHAVASALVVALVVGGVGATLAMADGDSARTMLRTAFADAFAFNFPNWVVWISGFAAMAPFALALPVQFTSNKWCTLSVPLTLGLLSRGATDAPLRALCATFASLLLVMAVYDERLLFSDEAARKSLPSNATPTP